MSGPREAATAAAICPLCNSSRWCGRACKHHLDKIEKRPPDPPPRRGKRKQLRKPNG